MLSNKRLEQQDFKFSAVADTDGSLLLRRNTVLQLLNSEIDDAELDIDALVLTASQDYERTLLTPSRPNVGPNLPAPSSAGQLLRRPTRFLA